MRRGEGVTDNDDLSRPYITSSQNLLHDYYDTYNMICDERFYCVHHIRMLLNQNILMTLVPLLNGFQPNHISTFPHNHIVLVWT